MADLAPVYDAIRKAHAAGDSAAAAKLSAYIKSFDAPGQTAPAGEGDAAGGSRTLANSALMGDPSSGVLWPISYSASGDPSFDSNAGVLGVLKNAFALPGDVYAGKVDPFSPEGMNRATEFAGVFSPRSVASAPAKALSGAYKALKVKAPTRAELKEAASAGYKKVADLDIKYNAPAVEKMAMDLENALNEKGFIAPITGGVHDLIGTLKGAPGDSYVKMSSLDSFRQRMQGLAGSPDAQISSAANEAIRAADDFIGAANPATLVDRAVTAEGRGVAPGGQSFAAADVAANKALAEKASKLILEARGNAAAGFRSDRVTGLEKTAARRTAAANSGRNTDNAIRQRLTTLVESQKGSRGLSKEEVSAIDKIIFGKRSKNALRNLSNLLGGGGGLGQTLLSGGLAIAGATLAGPAGALLMVLPQSVGNTARGMANRMSKKELKLLDDMIRKRSPLHSSKGSGQISSAPSAVKPPVVQAAAIGGASNGNGNGTALPVVAGPQLMPVLPGLLYDEKGPFL